MNSTVDAPSFHHSGFDGQIGFARADITPPLEIYARNWGAAKHDVADSIHRPLTLSAMVISCSTSGQKRVLIEGDLSWWRGLDVWHDFQAKLLDAIDLPAESLIFSLTHSHAAPPLMRSDPQLQGGELLGTWLESVLKNSIELVTIATSRSEPAVIEWHTGTCHLAQTRDLIDPTHRSGRRICGFDPSKQADSTLLVGRVTNAEGNVLGVLVNYACHPTTLAFDNRTISPDFIGAMRETIEAELDSGLALFLQGASGELSPREQYVSDTAVADRHGRQLGHAALATLADMNPPRSEFVFDGVVESGAPLATWKHQTRKVPSKLDAGCLEVTIPLKDWPTARSLEESFHACEDRALKERLFRQLAIRRALGDNDHYEIPFWIWRTGDTFWVGSMAESYSVLQQTLRNRFPDNAIVCLNLINGSIGYLPPSECYDKDIYQVWQTPFDQGALEKAITEVGDRIESLLAEE